MIASVTLAAAAYIMAASAPVMAQASPSANTPSNAIVSGAADTGKRADMPPETVNGAKPGNAPPAGSRPALR